MTTIAAIRSWYILRVIDGSPESRKTDPSVVATVFRDSLAGSLGGDTVLALAIQPQPASAGFSSSGGSPWSLF